MSEYAILKGVETYLRTLDGFDENNCEAMVDGSPNPMMKDFFCAIHLITNQNRFKQNDQELDEIYSIGITLTKRINAIPKDRVPDSVYMEAQNGLARLIDRVKFAVHTRHAVMNAINTALTTYADPANDQFIEVGQAVEPFRFQNRSATTDYVFDGWMSGDRNERKFGEGMVALKTTLRFSGLRVITQVKANCE